MQVVNILSLILECSRWTALHLLYCTVLYHRPAAPGRPARGGGGGTGHVDTLGMCASGLCGLCRGLFSPNVAMLPQYQMNITQPLAVHSDAL